MWILHDNDIGSNGAVTLADALKTMGTNIKVLNLNGNNIRSEGAALADALNYMAY